MSRSPASSEHFKDAKDPESEFRRNLKHLNDRMDQGGSLSGREPNCAFLNTHGGQFANVAAVTGFDFSDDARGMAITDWDCDGDLDVWTSNRTAPRVRFLRNDSSNKHHYISLRLVGTNCNRDAVGARIRAKVDGKALTKTLRAGEGFLSQSSKWIHFGLGKDDAPIDIEVLWPGGTWQTYANLKINTRYVLVQGQKKALPRTNTSRPIKLAASEQLLTPPSVTSRILLANPIPAMSLPYLRFDGKAHSIDPSLQGPLLLNLWASNCLPCLAELEDLTKNAERIKAAKLNILALATDAHLEIPDAEQSSERILRQIGFPFEAGTATAELINRVSMIRDINFHFKPDIPVPTSLLFDRHGRLAAIYDGRLNTDQLLEDVQQLTDRIDEWHDYAARFRGKWNREPKAATSLEIPRDLMNRGFVDDAFAFTRTHSKSLRTDPEYSTLLVWIGDQLIESGRSKDGIDQYRMALEVNPNDLIAMNNFAWHLATNRREDLRNGALAVLLATRAANRTQFKNAGVLDTLAASHAEAGEFEKAIAVSRRAIQLADASGNNQLADRLKTRLTIYEQRQAFRSR